MEDLGEFLRSRRARVRPQDVGLPDHGRRRVPGLRREELAQLAGVSVDYYVRLEQGRGPNVSDAVLDAIARTLQLDDGERRHLYALARPPRTTATVTGTKAESAAAAAAEARRNGRAKHAAAPGESPVRAGVQALLDRLHAVPAFVLGRRMDVLAWNALADAVHGFADQSREARNAARHTFLDAASKGFYPDFEQVARETVAYLRFDHARHPQDARLSTLVRELMEGSADFRRLWAGHEVLDKSFGHKRIMHPVAGQLSLDFETMVLPGEPDQVVVTYVATDVETEERLRMLASWHAPMPDSR